MPSAITEEVEVAAVDMVGTDERVVYAILSIVEASDSSERRVVAGSYCRTEKVGDGAGDAGKEAAV